MSRFVRDVFISYSHKDNLSLSDDQLGWVDRFHRALSVRLTQLLGRDSTTFFDKAVMSGSDILTPKIRNEIADARVLVSIVSPGYLQSAWCNEELSHFATSAAASGVETGSTSRIVKVLKLPVEPQLEKRAKVDLSDVLGYKFYRTDARGIASEFDLDDEPQSRREFVKRVNELAYDMRKILDLLGEEMPGRSRVVAPTGKVVYVAETSSDLAVELEQLRSELAQFGHVVLPIGDLPLGPQFADMAANDLSKADLAIHLIGAGYAAVPERERHSTVELQYDLAGSGAITPPGVTATHLVAARTPLPTTSVNVSSSGGSRRRRSASSRPSMCSNKPRTRRSRRRSHPRIRPWQNRSRVVRPGNIRST